MSLSQPYLVQSLSQPSSHLAHLPTQYPRYFHSNTLPLNRHLNHFTDISPIPKTLIPDNSIYLSDVAANVVYFIWYSNPNPFSLPSFHTFRVFCIHVLNNIRMSPATVILALKYVQRLKKKNRTMKGELGSEYRIFIISMILAAKFLEDVTYTSQSWSTITGMPTREIAIMEREFLAGLRYELYVSNRDFLHWFQTVQMYCINQQQWLRRSALARKPNSNPLLLTQPYHPYEWPQANCAYYSREHQCPPISGACDYTMGQCFIEDTSTSLRF